MISSARARDQVGPRLSCVAGPVPISAMEPHDRPALGATVRLASLDADPYPTLAALRAREPVAWVPEVGMWLVTRRDDVVAILRDATRFTTESERSTIRDVFGTHMMTTDGDVALRYRRGCLHAFRADALARDMAPWVEARVAALLERARARAAFDVIEAVASPLAVGSALRVLGLPPELADTIRGWYADFALALANFTGDGAVRARGKAAASAFDEAVRPLLAEARPEDRGLLAHLASAGDDRLSDDEIVANALIILFGGIETTEAMIANTIWSLLATDRWGWYVADRSRGPSLVEEALRWQPSVQSITRHTTEDATVRGVRLPAGSIVQSMIGGANRDPEHFADPDAFDPTRANAGDHLSFGTGRHLCLGAHLARIEILAVMDGLARRAPTLAFEGGEAPRLRGYEFRRPERLAVVSG